MKQSKHINCISSSESTKGTLYLGNIFGAWDIKLLASKNITAVLSVIDTKKIDYTESCVKDNLFIPAIDVESFNLEEHFSETYEWLDKNLEKTNVLVHCQVGVSRSATIVIAYVMKKRNLGVDQAL